jgi:hypothetical protein
MTSILRDFFQNEQSLNFSGAVRGDRRGHWEESRSQSGIAINQSLLGSMLKKFQNGRDVGAVMDGTYRRADMTDCLSPPWS